MSLPAPHPLPSISIQSTYPLVVSEIQAGLHAAEDCWISCFLPGRATGWHGKVRVLEGEGGGAVELEARDGVECELVDQNTLRIACPGLEIPSTTVRFPSATPATLKGGVQAFALSPDGKRIVVAGAGGMVRCKLLLGEAREVVCKGHVGDVNVVKFFPSSEVILTGSTDMSIRIFSALDGTNPRTLVGHTKPLTSLHIVGKGRRILSSSMDGTVRLWDVAKGKLLQRWNFPLPVTGSLLLPPAKEEEEEEEEEAKEWHLLTSYTNGTASLSSLSLASSDPTPRLLLSPASSSPVESLAYTHFPRPIVALGSREGVVSVFLLPPVGSAQEEVEPAVRFSRSGSSVRVLQFISPSPSASPTPAPAEVQLVVATSDGLPFSVTLQLEREGGGGQAKVPVVAIKEEFAGLDCEAATGVVCTAGGGAVWVSGADGSVRKYVRS